MKKLSTVKELVFWGLRTANQYYEINLTNGNVLYAKKIAFNKFELVDNVPKELYEQAEEVKRWETNVDSYIEGTFYPGMFNFLRRTLNLTDEEAIYEGVASSDKVSNNEVVVKQFLKEHPEFIVYGDINVSAEMYFMFGCPAKVELDHIQTHIKGTGWKSYFYNYTTTYGKTFIVEIGNTMNGYFTDYKVVS